MSQPSDTPWYKDAVIYEIPIRAYRDSNCDGIGDIRGLIEKLDYLSDLGVTALWLLPFYPSPHLDGGYDIADYTSVHPMYGTLDDFKELLKQAHERGLRVITELVINHTSKEHPWFQKSRRSAAGEPWRDFYVWSDDPKRYKDARIIFKDYETSNWTWDPVAKAYYWHRFYHHQPDLNFENSAVHDAVIAAMDFWFDLGVDGLRLDAIPYLYEREGTTSENLPETHAFLKKLRAHIDGKYADRMLLAEANQWPEDAVAYFGDGDECHMNFHFPLMPRMFMALEMEDRFPIIDILEQTPNIPQGCQWATFLRNHDELTLEMVTDEDRDYMYRVYAEDPSARLNLGIRRRLAPLLESRQQIEAMMGLLFALPGTPVLYYGDEIGMGDNIYLGDRDGVRTPMQWSADKNAGFSSANPQKLYLPVTTDPEYRYEAVNVETQERNTSSLLWWTKRLIAQRKRNPALSRGSLTFLPSDNARVLTFLRESPEQRLLIVANLSRLHQAVELDLAAYAGQVPFEVTGGARFPRIELRPYVVMLPPRGFLWLELKETEQSRMRDSVTPECVLSTTLVQSFRGPEVAQLEQVLAGYVLERRWFKGKDRVRSGFKLTELIPLSADGQQALGLFEVEYAEGEPERYVLPLALLVGAAAAAIDQGVPQAVIARVLVGKQSGLLVEGLTAGVALAPLLSTFVAELGLAGKHGELRGYAEAGVHSVLAGLTLPERVEQLEQTNTTVVLGGRLLFKLFRQVDFGQHPEIELGKFLVGKSAPVPRLLGHLEYKAEAGTAALGVLHEFVPNEGNGWEMTLSRLRGYFERVLAHGAGSGQDDPGLAFYALARLLGQRTAELHLALVGDDSTPEFAPEAFSSFHQKSIYQRARGMFVRTLARLEHSRAERSEPVRAFIDQLSAQRGEVERRLRRITQISVELGRIRTHGDLHLGQVLFTGQDFVLIDFEGEPSRPLHERNYKRCPLRDVMGLLRSFDYATASELRSGQYREEDVERLSSWARGFRARVGAELVEAYLERAAGAVFLPRERAQVDELLDFYELEKVIYEIRYEMESRPDWLELPLAGLSRILAR